ncbi:MAG: mgsA [Thermoleophilia bacterium]|jgi:methylglyoxal synthase|nr:mgsA [Thermoleophilia bacterium]
MDRYVALIAHDACKDDMLELVVAHRAALAGERLVATGTTGTRVAEATGLDVKRMLSGPLGGDMQIGALVAEHQVKLVIFLRDPLNAHPHDPDIQALLKICDVHNVPLASNRATAELCLEALGNDGERMAGKAGSAVRRA